MYTHFSISILIKILFLSILILLGLSLFYLEIKQMDKLNQEPQIFSKSGPWTKTIKNTLVLYIPALSAYVSLIETVLKKHNKSSSSSESPTSQVTSQENSNESQNLIESGKEVSLHSKKVMENYYNIPNKHKRVLKETEEVQEMMSSQFTKLNEMERVKEGILKYDRIKNKLLNHEQVNGEDLNSLQNFNENKQRLMELVRIQEKIQERIIEERARYERLREEISQLEDAEVESTNSNRPQISNSENNDSIVKSSFILNDLYSKFKDFISSLSVEEILAFSGLLLNGLILSHTISIILNIYGDYLINRFNLETRYPKLERFILLKRKFSNYNLKISFIWIFLCIIPQLYIYSLIIGYKLYEFIFSQF